MPKTIPVLTRHHGTKCDEVIYMEEPPACVDCFYYEYDRGSWCKYPNSLITYNVITGETGPIAGPTRCQEHRFSEHESHCGLAGQFFKSK